MTESKKATSILKMQGLSGILADTPNPAFIRVLKKFGFVEVTIPEKEKSAVSESYAWGVENGFAQEKYSHLPPKRFVLKF